MSAEEHRAAETLSDALRRGKRRLASTRTTTPGLDAEVLLRHVLGVDRTALFVRLSEPISAEDLAAYDQLLAERARDIPVAYLTGEREFMGMPLEVGPAVLVPRPETELLVAWAISWLREREREPVTVVDVGTGSGAIAIEHRRDYRPALAGTYHRRGRFIGRPRGCLQEPCSSRFSPSHNHRPGFAVVVAAESRRPRSRQPPLPAF